MARAPRPRLAGKPSVWSAARNPASTRAVPTPITRNHKGTPARAIRRRVRPSRYQEASLSFTRTFGVRLVAKVYLAENWCVAAQLF